jgi:hypothetical protein
MEEVQFFDRKQAYSVAWKTLPHWAQAGTVAFITWRAGDSLPAAAARRITRQRTELFQQLGLLPGGDWDIQVAKLPPGERRRANWSLFTTLDAELDHNFGECVPSCPE